MLPAEQTARTTSRLESDDDDPHHVLLQHPFSHFHASYPQRVRSLLSVPAHMTQFFLRKDVLVD